MPPEPGASVKPKQPFGPPPSLAKGPGSENGAPPVPKPRGKPVPKAEAGMASQPGSAPQDDNVVMEREDGTKIFPQME